MADLEDPTPDAHKNAHKTHPFGDPKCFWLQKHILAGDGMDQWAPNVRGTIVYTWEIPVLSILAEDYCSMDAYVVSVQYNEHFHEDQINFGGYCPFHHRTHHQQHWALCNAPRYGDMTKFICFHGNVVRWIWAKLPF